VLAGEGRGNHTLTAMSYATFFGLVYTVMRGHQKPHEIIGNAIFLHLLCIALISATHVSHFGS
jgi:hypothetical protein